MRLVITKNYEEMSQLAADCMLGQMLSEPNRVNMAITGGATPARLYELLIPRVKEKTYLDHVHYYNFDEVSHKKTKHEGTTITELRNYFFNPAAIPAERIHLLDETNDASHDERLARDGGLDLILLGVGADGHFCGNMPGTTKFSDYTTRVPCDDSLKQMLWDYSQSLANPHFTDREDIPDFFITMGPRSVMRARHLLMVASGVKKAGIVRELVQGNIDPHYPSTILTTHPNMTLIVDQEAASLLDQ